MTASERSLVGFAVEETGGTPITDDSKFKYMLVTRGSAGLNNQTVPLDMEVGGGAVMREVVKTGVVSGGQFEFIPRANSLGMLLAAMVGKDTYIAPVAPAVAHTHEITLDGADEFFTKPLTCRFAPGKMWGEVYTNCKIVQVGLNWRAANFVRGSFAFLGQDSGAPDATMTGWASANPPDGVSPFITPTATIALPVGAAAADQPKVLSGSFMASAAIPLDEQWVVGGYRPDALDATQKAFAIQLAVKLTNKTLYEKIMYDGNGTVSGWAAEIMKEANITLNFKSSQPIPDTESDEHYELSIAGNGTAAPNGNIVWSGTPIGLRAGSQVVMSLTGIFLADATKAVSLTLKNDTAAAYF